MSLLDNVIDTLEKQDQQFQRDNATVGDGQRVIFAPLSEDEIDALIGGAVMQLVEIGATGGDSGLELLAMAFTRGAQFGRALEQEYQLSPDEGELTG